MVGGLGPECIEENTFPPLFFSAGVLYVLRQFAVSLARQVGAARARRLSHCEPNGHILSRERLKVPSLSLKVSNHLFTDTNVLSGPPHTKRLQRYRFLQSTQRLQFMQQLNLSIFLPKHTWMQIAINHLRKRARLTRNNSLIIPKGSCLSTNYRRYALIKHWHANQLRSTTSGMFYDAQTRTVLLQRVGD